ncbi:MAG: glycosyltransferase family 2 protein [Cyclobacteriaceae bacterium]
MKPYISVVIPVKNGEKTIKKCLDGLLKQTLFDKLEIIIVDSGSNDSTLEILSIYPIRLIQIDPGSFNHGGTRNLGVKEAKGDLVFMTVQDAWTEDVRLLEKMAVHFLDSEVVGVCGQQVVPHLAPFNPHEWFRPVSSPEIRVFQFENTKEFEKITPEKKRWICGWDDVVAMYRRSTIKNELPFSQIEFGEDLDWAQRALRASRKIVYDTHAQVNHYHHLSGQQVYDRIKKELRLEYESFRKIPDESFPYSKFLKIVYYNFKYKSSLRWIWYNWSLVFYTWKAKRDFIRSLK